MIIYCRHCLSQADVLIIFETNSGHKQGNNSCYKCIIAVAANQMLDEGIDLNDDESIIAIIFWGMLRDKLTKQYLKIYNHLNLAPRNTNRILKDKSILKKD